jgi:tetratricopeptide (TPR) repeat protein
MFDALSDKKEERAQRLFDRLQELEDDPTARKVERARWLSFRYYIGSDPEGLDKLKALADNADEARPEVLFFMGLALDYSGELLAAADAFHETAETSTSPEMVADAGANEGRCLQKAGEPARAVQRLQDLLRRFRDDAAMQGPLWRALGDVYQQQDEHELRGLALQQALERRPGDAKLRFQAAYAFSDAEEDALAPLILHHYGKVLALDPDYAYAWNNSAVQFGRLNLPITSIARYRRAADLGNTLALANIANKLMGAGFADEAEETLARANEADDPHENVAHSTASLAEKRRTESERRAEILSVGQRQAEFLRLYTRAAAFGASDPFAGTWRTDAGDEATVTLTEGNVTGEWTVGKTRHKLEGVVRGGAAEVSFYEMGYSGFGERRETGWSRKDRGYAHLSDDGNVLSFMRKKTMTAEFERFSRTAAPPPAE